MTKTPPTWQDVFVIRHKADAEALAERLKAKGYHAVADYTGACHSDDDGHYHPYGILVRLTPAQAERLAR